MILLPSFRLCQRMHMCTLLSRELGWFCWHTYVHSVLRLVHCSVPAAWHAERMLCDLSLCKKQTYIGHKAVQQCSSHIRAYSWDTCEPGAACNQRLIWHCMIQAPPSCLGHHMTVRPGIKVS